MKINVMHIRDSGGMYGAERVILTLAAHLDTQRFNATLLCMKGDDGGSDLLIQRAQEIGIRVVALDVKGKLDLRAMVRLRAILRENAVDIIHSHDFKSDFYALLSSMGLGIKRVATAHGSTRDSLLMRAYLLFDEKVIYRFYDKIIAVSKELCGQLSRGRKGKTTIEFIQNGLDETLPSTSSENREPQEQTMASTPKTGKVFGVVGRLYPDKGHRYFLEAL